MSRKRQLRKISAKLKEDKERYRTATEYYDALHASRIGAHLPSNEEEYKTAEHHSELCDSTKRRGAGEIKGGGLVLRPGGMGSYREFHDLYTREKEKRVKKKPINLGKATQELLYGPQTNVQVIAFPDNFCILCEGEVKPNRPGCDGGNKNFPDCLCCSMVDITEIQHSVCDGRLGKGDVLRSFICARCKVSITQMQKQNREHGLSVYTDGREIPMWVIKQALIYQKLEENWNRILHNARIEPIEGMQGMRVQGVGRA